MNRDKIYNFSAGPSTLPLEVLERAQAEMLSYGNTGMPVMELGAGSPEYKKLVSDAEVALRKLMNIPANYSILFMQGGASSQFSAVPMNLLSSHKCADYVISGQMSKRACNEAKKYGDIVIAASSGGSSPPFGSVPNLKRADFRPDADYVHICYNNTLYGTKFNEAPETGNIPLVADMTSCICSEPINVSKFGLIYAGAEVNIGSSGLTLVIVRGDLIGGARKDTPSSLNYSIIAEGGEGAEPIPAWSVYITKLVLEWMLSIGGLEEMKRRNEKKASLIYDFIDGQGQHYYTSPVDKNYRSMMNISFHTGDGELDKRFIREAEEAGLVNLAGDSSVGGICATISNFMPYEGVEQLVKFMKEFMRNNPNIQS